MTLLLLSQLTDSLTTYAFTQFGGVEAHPFLRYLISMGRWDLLVAGKLIWAILFWILLRLSFSRRNQRIAIVTASTITALVCIWNTIGLLWLMP